MTEPVGPEATRVFLALCRVHARDGRATLRSVAAEAGRAVTTVYLHLLGLQREGLVAGVEVRGGVHPLYGAVRNGT